MLVLLPLSLYWYLFYSSISLSILVVAIFRKLRKRSKVMIFKLIQRQEGV